MRRPPAIVAVLAVSLGIGVAMPAAAGPPPPPPALPIQGIVHPQTTGAAALGTALGSGNLTYHGGPVMHSNTVYAIFWQPAGTSVSSAYKSIVTGFLQNVAAASGLSTNVYSTSSQYTDGSGAAAYATSFGGAVTATDPFPNDCLFSGATTCVSRAAEEAEIGKVAAAQGWHFSPTTMFMILLPQNVAQCASTGNCAYTQYCAYHTAYQDAGSGSYVQYANIPYPQFSGVPSNTCDAGVHPNNDAAGDAAVNLISHEHLETITDPLLDAWYDAAGYENADKCAWNFGSAVGQTSYSGYNEAIGSGTYYLQQEFDNSTSSCVQRMSSFVGGFSPASGRAGDTVTLNGAGLQGATDVSFADASRGVVSDPTFSVNGAGTQITAHVPLHAGTGYIQVTVPGVPTLSTADRNAAVFFNVLPTIDEPFSPTHGPINTPITFTGDGFLGTKQVTAGGSVMGWNYAVNSNSSITVYPVAGSISGRISITNAGGWTQTAGSFTVDPVITSMSPLTAPVGGSVGITGSGFGVAGDQRTITVGGVVATQTYYNSPTQIGFVVPAGATNGHVTVQVGNGVVATSPGLFGVPASLTGFDVPAAQVGQQVQILGTQLTGSTAVKFNGVSAPILSIAADGSSITTSVPAGALTGTVTVTTVSGTLTSGTAFKVLATIDEPLTPTQGAAGSTLHLTGQAFTGTTAVYVAGIPASFTVNSYSTLTLTIPSGAWSGQIALTNAGGGTATSGSFLVTPKITGYTPSGGAAGTTVTISGSGLGNVTNVSFNGATAPVVSDTANSLKVTVPPDATVGPIKVTTVAGNVSTASAFSPTPKITGVGATTARVGDTVTVNGTNLGGASAVKVGSKTLLLASWTVVSATEVDVVIPAGVVTGSVSVTTPAGTATSPATLKVLPTIDEPFSPTSGAAGTVVSLTGFTFTGTSAVKIGGVAASFTVSSNTLLKVTVPTAAVTGTIAVTNAGGTTTTVGSFAVTPKITGFSPSSAVAGGVVAISGTGLGGTTAVRFNGTSASFTVVSGTSVKVAVPPTATSGLLALTVAGGASASSAASFKPVPSISALTPANGLVGSTVTVDGANFGGATSVSLGGVATAFSVVTPTQVTFTVPATALTGKVIVTTPGGTSAASAAAFGVRPTITEPFSPLHGPVGSSVVLAGNTFKGTSAVTIGGVGASFTVISSTSLKLTIPSAAPNGPISVVNAGGTTTTSGSFYVDPAISSFTPGSAAVGATVTVSGTGFGAAGSTRVVRVNGVLATATWVSPKQLKLVVPVGATTGPITVGVDGGPVAASAHILTVV